MRITEDRSYKIQVLRGLAIIAVVFIHNTPAGMAQVWCRPFLNFAVGMFLFLSGMLSHADKWHPLKRILKVIIPYIIWTLIYVIVSDFKMLSHIPRNFVLNLITGKASAVLYYVFVYCELTLLIPLIDKLARSRFKYLGFMITPAEIIFMRLLPILGVYSIGKYAGIIRGISCIGWFTYFYLGYLIGNDLLEIRHSNRRLWIIWGIAVALQMLEGYWYYSLGVSNCGTQMKLTAVFAGSFFVLIGYKFIISNKKYNLKLLFILGEYSFGKYLAF